MNFLNKAKAIAPAIAVAALVVSPLGARAAVNQKPGEGVTIKMARATWDTGWFQTEVYRQMLEKLGYNIPHVTTLDNPPFYQAVGQGDMDLWVNGWFPLHNSYEKAFQPGARKIGYVAKGGALQGYLVDKRTAERLHITSLQDFKRPEVVKAFDANGDGKADLVACPPGWGCEKTIAYQLDAYHLHNYIKPIKASYSASMADAIARYKNGGSIFFYTWTPNWTLGVLKPGKDVVWLTVNKTKLPPSEKKLRNDTTLAHLKGCTENPCNLGWPANNIRPVANKKFLKANPAAATLLKDAHIPIKAIFAQNAKMNKGADSAKDIKEQASQWIADNRDMVNKWLNEARKAASM